MKIYKEKNNGWSSTWAFTCHAIWSWRNKEIHDDNYMRPLDNVQQILVRKLDYENAMKQTAKVNGRGETGSIIGWKSPKTNMVKRDTDGARKARSMAECKGVYRDERGIWISGLQIFKAFKCNQG